MQGQVRYVVRLDDMNVVSQLRTMEGQALKTEQSVASLNSALRGIGAALGIGLGLHSFINFGKDAVQGAADYETAVKRIKFASENLSEGEKNIAFIREEVTKFKIPLQDATDAYGKFLAMLAGSGIAGDRIRSLHDDLLLIGKIKGLDDGQMNAAVMNLGKMLESGSLDARHFRPLEQQLSGIGAFVAKELGISVHQLAILRNKGMMAQIDPKVLLTAIRKQRESLEQFLPESTNTIQSQLNDLSNQWLEFKNNLVFDNISELKSLFQTLKDGVGWLKEHEGTIITVGKAVATVAKYWLEYKAAMLLLNGALTAYKAYSAWVIGSSASEIAATEGKAVAYNSLALAIERMNIANQQATVYGAAGLGATGIPLKAAGTGLVAAEGYAMGAAGGAAAGGFAVMPAVLAILGTSVVVDAVRALAIATGLINDDKDVKRRWEEEYARTTEEARLFGEGKSLKEVMSGGYAAMDFSTPNSKIPSLKDVTAQNKLIADLAKKNAAAGKGSVSGNTAMTEDGHIIPPNDRVTGQRVITYNITIKEINGIKQNTVNEGAKFDTESVANEMADIIQSIVNDSQIRAGN